MIYVTTVIFLHIFPSIFPEKLIGGPKLSPKPILGQGYIKKKSPSELTFSLPIESGLLFLQSLVYLNMISLKYISHFHTYIRTQILCFGASYYGLLIVFVLYSIHQLSLYFTHNVVIVSLFAFDFVASLCGQI